MSFQPGHRGLPSVPCACATLRRATRAVTQLYDTELRECGLRVTQFTLLQALELAGSCTQGQLGELLALDSTTLSRTLKPLERQGWIGSRPGTDRRERNVFLTSAGRREMERARPHWERAQERLKTALGEPAWRQLFSAVDTMASAARAA